jgi:hypothetical protein
MDDMQGVTLGKLMVKTAVFRAPAVLFSGRVGAAVEGLSTNLRADSFVLLIILEYLR